MLDLAGNGQAPNLTTACRGPLRTSRCLFPRPPPPSLVARRIGPSSEAPTQANKSYRFLIVIITQHKANFDVIYEVIVLSEYKLIN
ncbi:hypothetical protein BC937DRAFT_90518 [Endogone sp. FLAS-F59071]|nr:hypothetical protein BC937DRAFT_90518 [Endogone sp. FLAS-F59071]|eukprot:RUS17029.1 hypothetical protein BC937DRAFT_90518 [Endogone sp. FLAS-F59071]